MRYLHVWALIAASLLIGSAHAIEIDQSTPKAAAQGFMKAVEAGDPSAKDLAIGNEQDQQLLSVMIQFSGAIKHLREAATKKFGEKADEVTGGGLVMDTSKALEGAQIKEEGDTATVSFTKPQPSTTYLKKVNGKWMINLTDTLKNAYTAGQDPAQFQSMVKNWSNALDETAKEIADGKYTTAAEAAGAIQAKMTAALRATSATSGPTTEPTAEPAR